MTPFLVFLALGCSAKEARTGLLLEDKGRLLLVEPSGDQSTLALSGDSLALESALGCTARVEGQHGLRRFRVGSWSITDSGYGTIPTVGVLSKVGNAWYVRNRSDGLLVELVEASMGGLSGHVGDLVLVDGYQVAPQLVKVVSYRVLREI